MLSISLRQLAAAAILAFAATACCGGASRKACTYDVNCTGGQVCRLDDAGGAFCSAKTGTAVGGSCDDREDCDHGSCLKRVGEENGVGICSMRCVTSNDCPVGFKTCLAISDSAGTAYCLPGAGNFRAPPSTKKKTGTTAKPPVTAKPPGTPPTQVTPPGGRPPGPTK